MIRSAKMLLAVGTMTTALGAGYACNAKSAPDARNDAVEAQREADRTALEARSVADKHANDTMGEANKKVGEANEEAREKIAKAQTNANDKIREANRDIGEQEASLRKWGQGKLDEVNHLIDDAKTKAQTAGPKVRSTFSSSIRDVELRRDALQTELASLETRTDTTYDKGKDEIAGRIDQLKDRIHQITRSL
jgi:hypothetical protein